MEIRKMTNRTDDARKERRPFAKMLLVSGTALALSCGNGSDSPPVCGSDGGSGGMDAGSETTDAGGEGGMDGGCVPRTPVCVSQSNSFLADKGMVVPVGDYRIRLDDTNEIGNEQVAVVSRLDTCNEPQGSALEIYEDTTESFETGDVTIRVSAAGITVTSPQQARLTIELDCPDSGVSDGGSDSGSD